MILKLHSRWWIILKIINGKILPAESQYVFYQIILCIVRILPDRTSQNIVIPALLNSNIFQVGVFLSRVTENLMGQEKEKDHLSTAIMVKQIWLGENWPTLLQSRVRWWETREAQEDWEWGLWSNTLILPLLPHAFMCFSKDCIHHCNSPG